MDSHLDVVPCGCCPTPALGRRVHFMNTCLAFSCHVSWRVTLLKFWMTLIPSSLPAILWYHHVSHSYFWTKWNFRDSETGTAGPTLPSTILALKMIWGGDPGNFWWVAAVSWHSGWCSKRPSGRTGSTFCGKKSTHKGEVRLSCLQ